MEQNHNLERPLDYAEQIPDEGEVEPDWDEQEAICDCLALLKAHPNYLDAADYGEGELDSVVRRAIAEGLVDGEAAFSEIQESLSDDRRFVIPWRDIVAQWRYQFKVRDRLIEADMRREREEELRAYLGENMWAFCKAMDRQMQEFAKARRYPVYDEELLKKAEADIDWSALDL